MSDAEPLSSDRSAQDEPSELSLVLTLAYDGTAYSGFAKQKDERLATVQGELERALAVYFRRPVETVCAGRTDAGVHALGQVVSCAMRADELDGIKPERLVISLNAITPDDIAIRDVRFESVGFSARFDAVAREYRYRIVSGPVPPLFLARFSWWRRGALDIEAMRQGAAHLIGEHDFKSFCKAASAEGKTTMRCVEEISIDPDEQLGEPCIVIKVVGNAFLHSMVRTIVGTLVQVGAGHRDPAWVREVLEARDREAAGETAPASGLTFWRVTY